MNKTEWLAQAFEKCGPNVDCGLKALGDGDPSGEHLGEYLAAAAARCYEKDYKDWFRRGLASVAKEVAAEQAGAVRLFDVPEKKARRLIRERLVLNVDGERVEYATLGLSGREGAKVLRDVAERDVKPAKTSIARCKFQLRLADAIEAESVRLGRDVSVAEVLGFKAAA